MARSKQPKQPTPVSLGRRRFLRTGGLVGAAALVVPTALVGAQQTTVPPPCRPVAPPVMTMAAEATAPADVEPLTTDSSGSDFMVDVIKSLGFEYICANPGSSFRGLHESIINYGGNQQADHQSQGSRAGHRTGRGGREAWRAGPCRCRYPGPLRGDEMKMRHRRLVAIGIVGAALSAGSSSAETRTPPPQETSAAAPAGNAEHGKTFFRKAGCYQCHSEQAQGGTQGPRLGPNPIAFRTFARYLRAPTGEMPPYTAKVMSDQDVADVYAFLRALPPAPPLSSLPLLQP